jgi:hypothetical protein
MIKSHQLTELEQHLSQYRFSTRAERLASLLLVVGLGSLLATYLYALLLWPAPTLLWSMAAWLLLWVTRHPVAALLLVLVGLG